MKIELCIEDIQRKSKPNSDEVRMIQNVLYKKIKKKKLMVLLKVLLLMEKQVCWQPILKQMNTPNVFTRLILNNNN